jgi:hypothetical protein
LIIIISPNILFAQDYDNINKVCYEYWDYVKNLKYNENSNYIFDEDLDKFKYSIFPLILDLYLSNNIGKRELGKIFIDNFQTENAKKIESRRFYIITMLLLMEFIGLTDPESIEFASGAKYSIIDSYYSDINETIWIVEYKIDYPDDTSFTGYETLIKKNDKWVVKIDKEIENCIDLFISFNNSIQ